jgi:hypothetical protein
LLYYSLKTAATSHPINTTCFWLLQNGKAGRKRKKVIKDRIFFAEIALLHKQPKKSSGADNVRRFYCTLKFHINEIKSPQGLETIKNCLHLIEKF